VPFAYQPVFTDPEPAYWKQCLRRTHPNAVPDLPGWDLAEHTIDPPDGTGYLGMTHHSQFRCVRMTSDADGLAIRNALWNGSTTTMHDRALRWNNCSVISDGDAANPRAISVGTAVNGATVGPQNIEMSCTALNDVSDTGLPVGTNGWVLTRYINGAGPHQADAALTNYGSASTGYHGGCINECVDQYLLLGLNAECPGYREGRPGQACDDQEYKVSTGAGDGTYYTYYDYGKITCGCGPSFAGVDCEVPCPTGAIHEVSVSEMFNRGRLGGNYYWSCGTVEVTDPLTLIDPFYGYTLQGGVSPQDFTIMPPQLLGPIGCDDASPNPANRCQYFHGLKSPGCATGFGPCYTLR